MQVQTTFTPLSEWLTNDRSGAPWAEQSVVAGEHEEPDDPEQATN